LCSAMPAVKATAWVSDTTTTGGQATSAFDQYIPALPGNVTSFGAAINNAATPAVVGYSCASISGGSGVNPTALVWTYGAATSQTVSAYATGLGASNLSGWTFQYAEGINNGGEIVGWGTIGGVTHGFALLNYTVPEPSSLVLLAAGLLGLLACAWRKRL
jgi:hypothetical protein